MTTASNTDIEQLKEFIKDGFNELKGDINQLDRKIDNKFHELDRKISEVKSELKQEISEVKSELKQEISDIRGDIKTIDARFKNVETAIQKIPDISEKFGELKNWRQIAFIIIAAVVGWFARNGRGV